MSQVLVPYSPEAWDSLWASSSGAKNEAYKKALYVQYVHETGNGSSNLYKEYYNLFGMSPARKRQKFWDNEVSSSEGAKATYADPIFSLNDRINLDEYFGNRPPTDVADIPRYYADIQGASRNGDYAFAADKSYSTKLLNLYRSVYPSDASQAAAAFGAAAEEGASSSKKGIVKVLAIPLILCAIGFIIKRLKR